VSQPDQAPAFVVSTLALRSATALPAHSTGLRRMCSVAGRGLTALDVIARAAGVWDAVVLLQDAQAWSWPCPYNIFVRQRAKRAISC